MQAILSDIGAILGVTGSFVCAADGRLLAASMPAGIDRARLEQAGRILAKTCSGLQTGPQRKVGDIDLMFADGRLVVKSFGHGCLAIACGRNVNLPMVNLTANMALRKLKEKTSAGEVKTPPPPAPAAPGMPAAPVAPIAGSGDGVAAGASTIAVIEHELARAIGPVAMIVVDEAIAALGSTRERYPRRSLEALIDRLGREIKDEGKRKAFHEAAGKLS